MKVKTEKLKNQQREYEAQQQYREHLQVHDAQLSVTLAVDDVQQGLILVTWSCQWSGGRVSEYNKYVRFGNAKDWQKRTINNS